MTKIETASRAMPPKPDGRAPRVADPDRALALIHVPPRRRAAVAALFALDERLGAILRSTTEPLVGQVRLTWWHEALRAIDTGRPPAEPVLAALAAEFAGRGAILAGLVEGWEALLEEPFDDRSLARHAEGRGALLFEEAATRLGGDATAARAGGAGWALVDIAFNIAGRAEAERALSAARTALAATPTRWAKPLRPLGMLVALARLDAARGLGRPRALGGPSRAARLLAVRLTGRG